ncbi:MAG: hypothetical protein K2Q01_06470, partial [Rickettsiales bacterium]|nr:hypothetical protein [Rickettsiales bacterium]
METTEKADPAKHTAMEAVMAGVGNMVMSMREHQEYPSGTPARILSEPTYMRAFLTNPDTGVQEMFNPWGFTEKLTGHPTSGFDLATIEKIHALENWLTGLSQEDFHTLTRYASYDKQSAGAGNVPVVRQLAERIHDIERHFDSATKLDPQGETERASYFGKQRFDAIPELLIRQDRVYRSQSDNGAGDPKRLHQHYVTPQDDKLDKSQPHN